MSGPPDVTTRLPEKGERSSRITFSVSRILGPGFGPPREVPSTNGPVQPEDPLDQQPPIWIYCSRFSARPTAGPRRRSNPPPCEDRSRGRTAFTGDQVARLRAEFQQSEYLSDKGRRELAEELGLTEVQVRIWFQNARAKQRKSCGRQSPLAKKLAEAGLYNHSQSNPSVL